MKKIILPLLLLSISSYAFADEIVTLKNGDKAMLLDSGRWSIMAPRDKKAAEPNKEIKPANLKPIEEDADSYKETKLIDLKQDIHAFIGQQIKTEAFAIAYQFMLILKQDKMDPSSLEVNINKLSKEERKKLLEGCIEGCNAKVYGRVGDVIQGDEGIIADKVEW